MAYDTLIGHFDYGGESYSFVTTSELKFEQYRGLFMNRFITRIDIQTGSEKVRDVLNDIFTHELKIRLKLDLRIKSKMVKIPKHVGIYDCQIIKFTPYTFGAQVTIEGYMQENDYIKEKVDFT